MNEKQSPGQVITDEKGRTPEEAAQNMAELQAFLTDMVPEWNLRLFLEAESSAGAAENGADAFYPRSVLWVEKAAVTSYEACRGGKIKNGITGRDTFGK